jgi:hypothetical protein
LCLKLTAMNVLSIFVCLCEGKPAPILYWYRDNVLIDDSYIIGSSNNTVHNDLMINKLTRNDLNSVLSCKATNNLTKAITTSVSIDINRKTKSIKSR